MDSEHAYMLTCLDSDVVELSRGTRVIQQSTLTCYQTRDSFNVVV